MLSATDETLDGIPVVGGNGVRGYTDKYNTRGPALVIGRVGALCGCVHLIASDFWASEHAFVVYPRGKFNLRFMRYLLVTLDFNNQAIRTAQPLINTEIVENTFGVFPPQREQGIIADYLDRETAKLDTLIAAKERLLVLLSEKRCALITCAVTKGLSPDAPLRNSGISWFGEIAAHWATRRIALLFRERDERGEPELPLLEVSINTGVILREFSDDHIESTAADFNTYKIARTGDIVFNKMRMWQGSVGVAPCDGLVSPDYTVAAPGGALLSEYAGQLFRTEMFSAECARHSHGIVWDRLRLYWDGFRDIVVPLPPLPEQRAIVEHIQRETAKLDALREATERTISLLKERRSALITEAVTGKIQLVSPFVEKTEN